MSTFPKVFLLVLKWIVSFLDSSLCLPHSRCHLVPVIWMLLLLYHDFDFLNEIVLCKCRLPHHLLNRRILVAIHFRVQVDLF